MIVRDQVRKNGVKLGGLKAEREEIRYADKNSKQWMVEDFVTAIGDNARYLLYLRTPESKYARNCVTCDQILSTFRLKNIAYGFVFNNRDSVPFIANIMIEIDRD